MIVEKQKLQESRLLRQIGKKLKQYRLERKLTQEELAELAGFSRSYYTEVETGKRNISIFNLFKLAKALNISLSELTEFKID